MGIEHVDWALRKVSGVDANVKIILATLGNYADEEGCCWPSIPSIARASALSESTVRRHLRWLCDQGALTVETRHSSRGRQQSNVYRILLVWRGPPQEGAATGRENGSAEGCHGDTPVSVTGDPVTGDTPSPVTGDTPTTLNHHSEPSGKKEEEARALEMNFQKLVKIANPGPTESLQRGRLALAALSADEVEQAVKHAPAFFKAIDAERRKRPSIAIYLTERRWEAVARQAAMKPTERTGGKVFVRKGTDAWKAWAKVKGQDPDRMRPCTFSPSAGAEGWYFDTLFPPKQGGTSEDAA